MTQDERDRRPEHHIVHDYANLVSSGKIRLDLAAYGVVPPLNTHIWHAFYMNCRKMFEFFAYRSKDDYLRACDFTGTVDYTFANWNHAVQDHMSIHLLHVGGQRTDRKVHWTGVEDHLYFADFEAAWRLFLENLKDKHKPIFKEEIEHRLNSEFRHCGTLGKEFIL